MIIKILTYILFVLVIVAPTYAYRNKIDDRLNDIKNNKEAVIYLLIIVPVFIITYVFSVILSSYIPILRVGWLGSNLAFFPIKDLFLVISETPYLTQGLSKYVLLVVFIEFILTTIVIFNYYEEKYYRDSYIEVWAWAVMHMIMGIPLFAVIPIFSMGIVFKKIKEKKGFKKSYVAHVSTNILFISVIGLYLIPSVI